MKNKAAASELFDGAWLILSFATLIGLFLFADSVRDAVKEALSLCAFSLIPALFPYMVLCRLCVAFLLRRVGSSNAEKPGRTRVLFAVAIVLGWLSGFPGGAVVASSLYRLGALTKREAETVAALSDSVSPSFCLFIFGRTVLQSTRLGAVVYAAVLLSALLHGFAMWLVRKGVFGKSKSVSQEDEPRDLRPSALQSVPEIVASCATTMLNVCAFVVFFSAFGAVCFRVVARFVPLTQSGRAALTGVFELSSGVTALKNAPFTEKLRFGCLLCGFGGISAGMQVADVCREAGLSPRLFFITRLSGALLTLFLTHVLILLLPEDICRFHPDGTVVKSLLMPLTAVFILSTSMGKRRKSKKMQD